MNASTCRSCGQPLCPDCGLHVVSAGHVGGTGPSWDAVNGAGDAYDGWWAWYVCKTNTGSSCYSAAQMSPFVAGLHTRWPGGPKDVIDEWNKSHSMQFQTNPPSPPPQPQADFWHWVYQQMGQGGTPQSPPHQQGHGWDADYQGLGPYITMYAWYVSRILYGSKHKASKKIAHAIRARWPKPAVLLNEWNATQPIYRKLQVSPPVVPPMSNVQFWKWVWKSCGSPDF